MTETLATRSGRGSSAVHRPRRIAFLTPEFVTETITFGGLASYMARMTEALAERGYRPEVVTLSKHPAGTITFRGIPVHRVRAPSGRHPLVKRAREASHYLSLAIDLGIAFRGAWALAQALADLERKEHFDAVQSADFGFAGLFVPRRPWRTHVIRCSWSGELYLRTDANTLPINAPLLGFIERRVIRRADRAYAPSRFIADYFRTNHGLAVAVVRPPMRPIEAANVPVPTSLPARYLLHFGQLRRRKGTDVVIEALPHAWRMAPDLRMVIVGAEEEPGLLARARTHWGADADKVVYLGELDRPTLMAVVARAVASVLPSAVDNLPNTVIESLSLNVPVIGSAGASIDELIQHDVNGLLVGLGDVHGLAAAMVRAWTERPLGVAMGPPAVLSEMLPAAAVEHLVDFLAGGSS